MLKAYFILKNQFLKLFGYCFCLLILSACSSSNSPAPSHSSLKGEYIFRNHDEALVQVEPMTPQKKIPYPWEEEHSNQYTKITKDFFRCKGSSLNPSILSLGKKRLPAIMIAAVRRSTAFLCATARNSSIPS